VAARRFGLELSSDRVEAWVRGDGLVLEEPALAARQPSGGRLLGYGAQALVAAKAGGVELVAPFGMAELLDEEAAAQMLRHLINKLVGRLVFVRHELVLAVSAELSTAARRSLLEVALASGARMAHLLDLPLAMAFGVGLPVTSWEPLPVLFVLPGGAQAAIVCHHGLLAHRALLPQPSGDGWPGAPAELDRLAALVLELLAATPGQGHERVRQVGFAVAGRGVDLHLVGSELTRRTGLPMRVVADPQHCVVKGAEVALERIEAAGARTLLYLN